MSNTVDPAEIQAFSKDAALWWDTRGPHGILHKVNPVRMHYIRQQVVGYFGRNEGSLRPFDGLSILDIGCGGGLTAEPCARLGGTVTGVDADGKAVEVARDHARQQGLDITYAENTAACLRERYDVVLALEIIEHTSDPAAFIREAAERLKPNGLMILSTLNRTPQSYLFGIQAAERILGWVPQGTHQWKKFIKPSEMTRMLRSNNLKPRNLSGMVFNPLRNGFDLSEHNISINYYMTAEFNR